MAAGKEWGLADDGRPDRLGRAAMIRVLGPIASIPSDPSAAPVELPSATQRRLLAVLALHAPEPVRSDRLAELLGMSASGLRTMITRLRRVVGDDAVASAAGGYRITVPVDAHVFCAELGQQHAAGADDPPRRARRLEGALARWRGPAFDEFAHEEWAAGTVARLDEMHAAATEDHAEALLDAHRWSDAAAELSAHIALHPLRDRPRGLLMRALAGAGRQADALRAARDYRRLLAEEVGTEPSAAVQLIERRVASGWTGTSTKEPAAPPGRTVEQSAFPTPLSIARRGARDGRARRPGRCARGRGVR